jgi:hypothetical protein
VVAHVDGAASVSQFTAQTGPDGQAQLEFEMPAFAAAEPALVIEAMHAGAAAHLKFHLRAKNKVPTA